MKRRPVRNLAREGEQRPDCCTCIHRKQCERYAEGTFCTRWASREPDPQGPDPNEQWERGEEVDF